MVEPFAGAIREEAEMIADDPAIAENWDQAKDEPSVEGYKRYTKTRIDALNHAIKGLPADRIRFILGDTRCRTVITPL